jgi:hypothetical protein
VRVLSHGRRRRAVVAADGHGGLQTDLANVVLPRVLLTELPLRAVTIALALQSSPTKEAVASVPWTALRRAERRALAWVEGEHALRWAAQTWPGLAEDARRLFPWVTPGIPATDPDELIFAACERARGKRPGDPPFLFGRLPPPRTRASADGRRTPIATRWTYRHKLTRGGAWTIPLSGPDGGPVEHPGETGGLDALEGHGRRLGIPYDEWDYRRGGYRRGYAWVLESEEPASGGAGAASPPLPMPMPVLRPARVRQRGCDDGDIDVDAVVSWRCDLASGSGGENPRLYAQLERARRPTAWALLLDASASSLHDAARSFRAGLAQVSSLSRTLADHGHTVAVFAFRSSSHERVEVRVLKDFDVPWAPPGRGLKPGGYTRLGAAIRHAGRRLLERPTEARVLITLGDAVPSDEGYDGRYGQADVGRAVNELRARGVIVYHVLSRAREDPSLEQMFGPNGWFVAAAPAELHELLERIADDIGRSD